MHESLITDVVLPNEDGDSELEIRQIGDCIEARLKGKVIFTADWTTNIKPLFQRAIELWLEG